MGRGRWDGGVMGALGRCISEGCDCEGWHEMGLLGDGYEQRRGV